MNIQEAYNKGLDDAENAVMAGLRSILNGDSSSFANPQLDALLQVVKVRSDYYHSLAKRNNNIGKTFRKRIKEESERIDNPIV